MAKLGRQAAIVALLLGGLAVIAPSFLYGPSRLGGYGGMSGGYGGMMGGHGGMMGGYGGTVGSYGGVGSYGTGWSLFGILGQLGFLLLLIGAGYLLYRALVADDGVTNFGTSETSMDELRLAYARGEISDEEFKNRRKRLHQSGSSK